MNFFSDLYHGFYQSIIHADRWRFYVTGFQNTMIMVSLALLIGLTIGLVLAIFKVSRRELSPHKPRSLSGRILRFFIHVGGAFAEFYTTVIRGTPMLLQLLIAYFVIFIAAPMRYAVYIAALAFGVNSGAYVCEIIRAGIQSVDRGQTEAGRSLGLSSLATMRLIILPQAVRNILPALFNEFIILIKETSVAAFIGVVDITNAGQIVRSRVWTMWPLIFSAVIYLALVLILTRVHKWLERRLGSYDRRS